MAARRQRRKYARRAPGKSFWLRPPAFTITQRNTAEGVFSSVILTETDFEDPSAGLNDTAKGAPVLERIILDVGFDLVVSEQYFQGAGFNQQTMLVEAMVSVQPDQYGVLVTDSLSFDTVLENQRIIGYNVMDWDMTSQVYFGADELAPRSQIRCRSHFEPKSKVRLRETAVSVAIRTNMDIGDPAVTAVFPWVQPTMLVRIP